MHVDVFDNNYVYPKVFDVPSVSWYIQQITKNDYKKTTNIIIFKLNVITHRYLIIVNIQI